jgi:alkylation response protein AidB-like acyl-CoA dehydrogenase
VELGIAFEEMGRVLFCAPFFSTVGLAAHALLAAGDDQAKREYLPRIADGSLLATVAVTEADGRWDLAAVRTSVAADSGAPAMFLLDGTKMFVVDGHIAQVLLGSPGPTRARPVRRRRPGRRRRPHPAADA